MTGVEFQIRADGKQAEREVNRVTGSIGNIEALAGRIGGLFAGVFTAGTLTSQISQIVDFGGKIQDASDATGVSAEKLQEWMFAAEQGGASLEDLTTGLKRLKVASVEALQNPKSDPALAFERMGVQLRTVKNLKPEQLFELVAAKIGSAGEGAQVTSDMISLLGRNAESLAPAFRSGFQSAADSAKILGTVISNDTIKKLDETGDSIAALVKQAKAVLAETVGGSGIDAAASKTLDFTSNFLVQKQGMRWLTSDPSVLIRNPNSLLLQMGFSAYEAARDTGTLLPDRNMRMDANTVVIEKQVQILNDILSKLDVLNNTMDKKL